MRTYVTGFGLCSPLGDNPDSVFLNLKKNCSSTVFMPDWGNKNILPSPLAAPILNFNSTHIPRNYKKTMSRVSELATFALEKCIKSANLDIAQIDPKKFLYISGTATNTAKEVAPFIHHLEKDQNFMYGLQYLRFMNHSAAANTSSALGLRASVIPISSACATSSQAIVLGWELLKSGLYDIAICGGADELDIVTPVVFESLKSASTGYTNNPSKTPRPFDANRDGIVASEGASFVILETEASIRNRKATPLVELASGYSYKSTPQLTQNSTESIEFTISTALERAGMTPEDISYINAHASGTVMGDAQEALAVKNLFKTTHCPISSLKGHFGHSFAACGALELIMSILMMKEGLIIPTLNLDSVSEDCAGLNHVTSLLKTPINTVLSNNFGFGGINTSIIIKNL